MKIAPKLVLAASAIAITGTLSVLGTSPSAGAADQCPSGSGKVETTGDSATIQTNLPAGTLVCIKVGNATTFVTVGAGGVISNTTIFNKNGKLQGISNYVWYPPPTTTTAAPTTTMAPTTTAATTTMAPTTTAATTTMAPTTTTGS